MDERIVVLLIEDSDADAQAFRLNIVRNSALTYAVQLKHVYSVPEAFEWLGTSGVVPHLVCLDPGVPGLSERNLAEVTAQLCKYTGDSAIIGLTGADSNSAIFRALERSLGKENTFSKDAVWKQQEEIIGTLKEAIAKRSSGSSRAIQMDVVRMEERVKHLQDELQEANKEIKRLTDAVFLGGGDGTGSIVYLVYQINSAIPGLVRKADFEAVKADLEKVKQRKSDFNLQVWLKSLDFFTKIGLIFFLGVALVLFAAWFGFTAEQVFELLKGILQ